MSMEEWPDDHLDNLFRKSAEEYDVPFNADDWTDMSRRLDGLDRQTLFDHISRWGGISALVLLLLASLGWLVYDKPPAGNDRQAAATFLTAAATSGTSLPATSRSSVRKPYVSGEFRTTVDTKPTKTDEKRQRQQTEKYAADPAEQLTTNSKADYPPDKAGRKVHRSPDESLIPSIPYVKTMSREKQQVSTSPEVTEKKAPRLATQQFITRKRTKSGPDEMEERVMVNNRRINRTDLATVQTTEVQPIKAEAGADAKWLPSLTQAPSVTNVVQQVRSSTELPLPEVTVAAVVQRAVPRLSRLSVMLFASPDLSAIGLRNFDRPGSNAGLALQYQITDRLSLNTGAMYSTKRYQTYSSEYVWPAYTKMDVWPEGISGVCKMIDIPLNVRYDWLLRPRGDGRAPARWFASAGLTSYFIQHEVYNYEYANPGDSKIKYWGWDNKKAGRPGGSFGFSNLNVSVGYERPITHRLSWQVEPFMKVPLAQVGYFKVKLLSTGAFVGLRYRL